MKIVTVLGARPQFIKASALSRKIATADGTDELVIHTGQHYDHNMSDVFFDELGMPAPSYNLEIGGFDHSTMTGRMVEAIGEILSRESPQWVVLYGDTNSTLAAAIAAGKMKVPVAHIEAGLRSYNFGMPEEQNRVITDRIASALFCPTELAVTNLKKEGYPFTDSTGRVQHIENVGDIMLDVFMHFDRRGAYSFEQVRNLVHSGPSDYVLVTIHRPENTDSAENMRGILGGLRELSEIKEVVFAVHPRTMNSIERFGLERFLESFSVIPPQPYFQMQALVAHADRVVTDSGGLQKEAYFHETRCVTIRQETEWLETTEANANTLCRPVAAEIFNNVVKRVEADFSAKPYGTGDTAEKVLAHMTQI